MGNERRRYFRINEMVGISYQVIDEEMRSPSGRSGSPDLITLFHKEDQELEKLILDLDDENPKVARLISLVNQKLERIVQYMAMETSLIGRIASKVREANISACGIAFSTDEFVMEGTRINMELTLYPEEKAFQTHGFVVNCERQEADGEEQEGLYYWRVDFYNMSDSAQETLIQHIVQSQSQQLKSRW